jgi:hypothetical protein
VRCITHALRRRCTFNERSRVIRVRLVHPH